MSLALNLSLSGRPMGLGSGGGGGGTQEVSQVVVPNTALTRAALHGTIFNLPTPSGPVSVYLDFGGASPARLELQCNDLPADVGNAGYTLTLTFDGVNVTLYSGLNGGSGDIDVDGMNPDQAVYYLAEWINNNMSGYVATASTVYLTVRTVATGGGISPISFNGSTSGASTLSSYQGGDAIGSMTPDITVVLGTDLSTFWEISDPEEAAEIIKTTLHADSRFNATRANRTITVTTVTAGECPSHASDNNTGFTVSTITNGA